MEEEKAAAYYDELTRKGGGAARFKQGLGFSSTSQNDAVPSKPSAFPSLGGFVRASSPSKLEKQSQLQSIQNKLTRNPNSSSVERSRGRDEGSRSSIEKVRSRCRDRDSRRRSRSRDEIRKRRRSRSASPRDRGRGDREKRRRSRSRSASPTERYRDERRTSRTRSLSPRERYKESRRSRRSKSRSESPRDNYRDKERRRRRRRSKSRSESPRDNHRDKERKRRSRSRSISPAKDKFGGKGSRRSRSRSESPRDRYRDKERSQRRRSKSRSLSPDRRVERSRGDVKGRSRKEKSGGGGVDYTKLIDGYDEMSAAERVKAKMKLQLSETAKNDTTNGMGSGWERFNFDKDAPLDDEEVEGADDDKELVKHIGQSFRFSAVEAMREEKIKATHDEAIFGTASILPGTSSLPPPVDSDSEEDKPESKEPAASSLISDQVKTIQQGSWRDRVRKV